MPDACLNPDHHAVAVRGVRLTTFAACLMLALAGCASVAPPRAEPVAVDVPADWSATNVSATTGASSLVQWWLRFDDPLLTRLVAQALQANTDVKSAQAALRQARALRDVSAAALLPAVDSSASAQRSKSGDNSAVNTFKAGLDASWELDIFGANRSALAASDATARARAASLGDVQVSIAAEVALSYMTLRGTQARLAIAEANLASQQETLQITQWRLQAGLVTSLEAEQARAATEQTRAQLPVLQTTIEQTRHALAVLTGQPPAALSSVLAAASPLPQAADDLVLSFPAESLRQRPDVRAAEHQVTAALARVSQAEAARMPNFKLGGSLGLSALTLGSLSSGASVVSALLANVSLPVFDGGALRAQVRAQQAALDQARAAYQATILTALKDVEDALVALRGDRERLLRLQNAAEAAGNAALLARQRYSSGLVDFQVVLETQRTQLNTQDSVASARADVSADYVRLYKALGGGWNPDGSDATAAPTADTTRDPRS
ncbi:efflux transporter outer membrane subunit [Thiobacillus sp.]|uniref:efflux transporter outer membrane subunit n=1 Tax=Thiobacillus sp. TaxID=924 RepID=UPI0025E0847E|nr:efflux transporter outer membrane subunit [Thiobacillus sp.]